MGLLLVSSSLEWISLGIILLISIYFYFRSVYNFWKNRGIKSAKPVPPFGNLLDLVFVRRSPTELFKGLHEEFPNEPYVGMYEFIFPVLLIRDPNLIKHILVKDFTCFQDRGVTIDEELDPLTAHLLFLKGARWRNLRAKLTPTFTSRKIKMMFDLMNECIEELIKFLDKPAENEEMMEMKEAMTNFTTDVIGSCAFGLQFNAIKDEDSEFRKMGRRIFTSSFSSAAISIIRTICPALLRVFKIKTIPQDISDFFVGTVKETVEYREKNNIVRNDFMQLLIQLKNRGNIQHNDDDKGEDNTSIQNVKNEFTYVEANEKNKNTEIEFNDKLLAAQAFIFFLGGFETSSTTLSFCLYELACHPDIQNKLRESIKSTVKEYDGKITYDSLQNMPYLEQVIEETLRKHPPVGFLSREVTKPYVLPGTSVKFDVGQKIHISVHGLHHDAKYYPDPERFNPENFSSEAKAARPHYTYLPFGEGPRICIAMRFGLLQTKLGIATLLTNFEFSVCEKTEIPLRLDPKQIITTPRTGIWLRIKKCSST